MKKIKYCPVILFVLLFMSVVVLPGCYKLQTNFHRSTTDTLDAHLYKDSWSYLKSRAYGSTTDTIFRRMYDAIIYSGIDTNVYKQPGKTFIFFTNVMVTTKTTGLWAAVLTSTNKAAINWKSYSAADVKNYLQYLIINGTYSHYNLPTHDVTVTTMAAPGTYTSNPPGFKIPGFVTNPNSTMYIEVLNGSPNNSNTFNYPITVNDVFYVATSDLLATNGVVDVISTPI
ncbi:MAG: hypothetical protein JWQ06_955, partial [Mucilaginibacter sp.]|nr:hypothetical protein [Mucilaginibacter sp.]